VGGAGHEPPWRCRSARAPRWSPSDGGKARVSGECSLSLTADRSEEEENPRLPVEAAVVGLARETSGNGWFGFE
jgi:hypothetical protein